MNPLSPLIPHSSPKDAGYPPTRSLPQSCFGEQEWQGGESNVAWVQNPAVNMWVEIAAGSLFALTGFLLDTPVFPSPQKLACEYGPFTPHGRFARRKVRTTATEIPY